MGTVVHLSLFAAPVGFIRQEDRFVINYQNIIKDDVAGFLDAVSCWLCWLADASQESVSLFVVGIHES